MITNEQSCATCKLPSAQRPVRFRVRRVGQPTELWCRRCWQSRALREWLARHDEAVAS